MSRRTGDVLAVAATAVVSIAVAVLLLTVGPFGPERDSTVETPAAGPPPVRAPATPSAAATGAAAQKMDLGDGVVLHPGSDGTLPVSPRWVRRLAAPEAFAVDGDGDGLYVFDEFGLCIDLDDGTTRWKAADPSGHGLASDGGVEIGLEGQDQVRFWSPYNSDLTVERDSGRVVRLTSDSLGERPVDLDVLPAPRPTGFRIRNGLDRVVATDGKGRVLWRITVDEPQYRSGPPVAVRGGVALLLASGDLVVLDT